MECVRRDIVERNQNGAKNENNRPSKDAKSWSMRKRGCKLTCATVLEAILRPRLLCLRPCANVGVIIDVLVANNKCVITDLE